MLLCPPQHGKSTASSRSAPAWFLGHDPLKDVAVISATESLATEFGRDVRNTVSGRECRNVFPDLMLAPDSQAAGRWHTKQGGSFLSLGIGGQFFGRGTTDAIIDDPFASWEEAQRDLERERVWDWYTGTLYNRVRPGGAIVLIQHRTHEADLVGRLLERQKDGVDKWEVVKLPASPELWPERYTAGALDRIRNNTSPIKWSSLFLQNPVPEEGTFFRREWFKWYKQAPKVGNSYLTSDFAVTEDGGDFTSLGNHIVDPNDDLYLATGYWHGQTSADVWIEQWCELISKHKPMCAFGEAGPIRRSIEPFMVKRMRERNAYCRVEWLASIHDKASRARALQARASMGKVYLPDNEIGHGILAQLLAFPGGVRDDDVDMCGMIARVIDQAHPAIVAEQVKRPPEDRYSSNREEDSWRVA